MGACGSWCHDMDDARIAELDNRTGTLVKGRTSMVQQKVNEYTRTLEILCKKRDAYINSVQNKRRSPTLQEKQTLATMVRRILVVRRGLAGYEKRMNAWLAKDAVVREAVESRRDVQTMNQLTKHMKKMGLTKDKDLERLEENKEALDDAQEYSSEVLHLAGDTGVSGIHEVDVDEEVEALFRGAAHSMDTTGNLWERGRSRPEDELVEFGGVDDAASVASSTLQEREYTFDGIGRTEVYRPGNDALVEEFG